MSQETREKGRPASKVSSSAVHVHGPQRLCLQETSCACTEDGPPLRGCCLGVGKRYPLYSASLEIPRRGLRELQVHLGTEVAVDVSRHSSDTRDRSLQSCGGKSWSTESLQSLLSGGLKGNDRAILGTAWKMLKVMGARSAPRCAHTPGTG